MCRDLWVIDFVTCCRGGSLLAVTNRTPKRQEPGRGGPGRVEGVMVGNGGWDVGSCEIRLVDGAKCV
jgi:hypothetical protein